MKRIMLALLALALTAVPTFAADESAPGMQEPGMHGDMQHGDMQHMRHEHPEMMGQMMKNPQHMLAMAYHKNLVTFGKALEKVARQGDTVPRDFARSAITEMRRSADQMEIYHEQAAQGLPQELKAKHNEMAKKMAQHMTEMRTQLAQLDDLAKGDRVDSAEVLKRLEPILRGCEGMGCEGMGPRGMHGKGMHEGCMHDRGCGCGHDKMHGKGMEGCGQMMQGRQQMITEMKAQDAALAQLVGKMNSSTGEQKQAVMAEILNRLVKERAAMTSHLENMPQHMMQQHGGAMPPCGMQNPGADDDDADADVDDGGSDDMNSDDDSMNMEDMHMR